MELIPESAICWNTNMVLKTQIHLVTITKIMILQMIRNNKQKLKLKLKKNNSSYTKIDNININLSIKMIISTTKKIILRRT